MISIKSFMPINLDVKAINLDNSIYLIIFVRARIRGPPGVHHSQPISAARGQVPIGAGPTLQINNI